MLLPRHSGWVAAFVLTLLMAAVGAASEREPLTAAAIQARGSLDARTTGAGAQAELRASVALDAELPPSSLAPALPAPENASRPERPPPSNASEPSEGGTPAQEPTANESAPEAAPVADAPAQLEPAQQNLSGQAGAPIRFVLLLTNTADVPQDVTLGVEAPAGWNVSISPSSAKLGARETVEVRGHVVTPRLVGTLGTIAVIAHGSGGDDAAYVDLCTNGELNGCPRDARGWRRGDEARTEPEAAQNASAPAEEAPAPEPEAEPEPEAQPEPAAEEPQPAPASSSSSSGNATAPSNGTAPASSGGSSSSGSSASADAWVAVGAGRDESGGEGQGNVTVTVP